MLFLRLESGRRLSGSGAILTVYPVR
jgi:hypothetical protein